MRDKKHPWGFNPGKTKFNYEIPEKPQPTTLENGVYKLLKDYYCFKQGEVVFITKKDGGAYDVKGNNLELKNTLLHWIQVEPYILPNKIKED